MTKDNMWCMVIGFFICSILHTLPFTDAEQYRRAVKECEKTLPRNQHCKVVGVPE